MSQHAHPYYKPETSTKGRKPTFAGLCALISAALLLSTVVLTAWVGDDIFITLRTIDNLINGHGLRWNVVERVQAFSHPLWLFVLTIPYLLTREPYYTTLAVSVGCTGISCALLLRLSRDNLPRGTGVLLMLSSSRAFIDFSSSGLENPLSTLLFIFFSHQVMRGSSMRHLGLLAGSLVLNRLDNVVMVGPPLIACMLRSQIGIGKLLRQLIASLSPLLAWLAFSFVYYGALTPNTAMAKLHHSAPWTTILASGYQWVLFSINADWATLLGLALGTMAALLSKKIEALALIAGALLYCLGTVWAGGDFMGGRCLVSPLMVASMVLLMAPLRWVTPALMWAVAVSALQPYTPVVFGGAVSAAAPTNGATKDERVWWQGSTGLSVVGFQHSGPLHEWGQHGTELQQSSVALASGVGMLGYYAGPKVYLIDYLALGDPLLARLHPITNSELSAGHLERCIPAGYEQSVVGENVIEDPSLHLFYDVVRSITREELWSARRLITAIKLQIGRYDHLVAEYEERDASTCQPRGL